VGGGTAPGSATPEPGPATPAATATAARERVVVRAAPPEEAATTTAYWTAERMASAVPAIPVVPGRPRPAATAPPAVGTPGAVAGGPAVTVLPAPMRTSTPVVLVSPAEVTLAANGGTVLLRVGERIRLALGPPLEWTPAVGDPAVLRRVGDAGQGVYEAVRPGRTELTAVGDPPCRRARPACMAPSLLFRVHVLVR
jgi:hypothetical protein